MCLSQQCSWWGWGFCSIQSCGDSCSFHLCVSMLCMWLAKSLEDGKDGRSPRRGFYGPGLLVWHRLFTRVLSPRLSSQQGRPRYTSAVFPESQTLGKRALSLYQYFRLSRLHKVPSLGEIFISLYFQYIFPSLKLSEFLSIPLSSPFLKAVLRSILFFSFTLHPYICL